MASPLKKIKLTPAKDKYTVIESLLTQETRITSTPQRSFRQSSQSPSLSSISSNHEQQEESFTSENETVQTSRSILSEAYLTSLTEEYGEDYDNYFNHNKRVKRTGQIWNKYKPIADDNLYGRILNDPGNTQFVVTELLLLYNTDPDVVIKQLIQFFIDVAGFQNFNAKQYYRIGSCEEDSKKIIDRLESDSIIDQQTVLKESGRYILMERDTSLVVYLRMGLYGFLQNLIESAHEMNILYDDIFIKCLCTFIRNMGESRLKCVRHTGVVVAAKVLTGIILVFNNLVNNPLYKRQSRTDRETELQLRSAKLESLIPSFYFIFHRYCRTQDKTVFMMRVECIREAKIWCKYFPKIFISHLQAFDLIIKLIIDASKEVRLAALDACKGLVGMTNVVEFLRPLANTLTTAVSQRFNDVDMNVVVKAVKIFSYLIHIIPEFITLEMMSKIKDLVFDQFAPVGKEACKCLLAYFYKQTKNPKNILLSLATILIDEQKGDCNTELLVEGCLYSCDEMQDWELFCEYILSEKLHDQERRVIAEIFAEAVKQQLTGKPSINRNMSKNAIDIDTVVHQRVADVLGVINTIIISYQDDISIIMNMLKIIVAINNNFSDKNYCKEYTDISTTIRDLFDYHSDEDLLTQIAEVLQYLCDIPNFAERAIRFAKIVCKEHAKTLNEFLKQPSQEENYSALKVAKLYKHFNLNDLLSFGNLTCILEELDLQTVSHLLICCKWNLIWSLRSLAEHVGEAKNELEKSIAELLKTCKIFTAICFEIFQHSNDKTLIMRVYSTVCEFFLLFNKELKFPLQRDIIFKNLELKIYNEDKENLLKKVLEENVICSKTMPLTERRKHVISYIDIVHYGILRPESLVNIFKYYYSYNKEYGQIIEQSLTSLSKFEDPNIIHFIVVYTLIFFYESILKKHGVVEVRSEEGVQLKLLAKQFATFQHFHERKNLFKLLCLLIQYAFRDEANLIFLCIIKCFVILLNNNEDKKKIQSIFNKKVKKEFEKNDAVLYFAMILKDTSKNRNSGKFVKPQAPKKKKTGSKENKKPKKKPVTKEKPKSKNTKQVAAKGKTHSRRAKSDTESTDADDHMSIHDSESDDLEESMNGLKI